MKILVFGAGAIGTYIGGSLAASGHAVTFVEKQHNAEAIRSNGLRLNLGDSAKTLQQVTVFTSPAEALSANSYDFAVFAIKSFNTASALDQIRPLIPGFLATSSPSAFPPILCLQNGVDNETLIAEVLGRDQVIAGSVTSAVAKTGVGEVVLERKRGVAVALNHPLSVRIVQELERAGLNARGYPSAGPMKWSKLLTNLIGNATSAILDMTVGELFSDKRLFAVEIAVLRECLAVMRKLGFAPVDLPGTPVRALAFVAGKLPRVFSHPLLKRALGTARGGKMPSFHLDLHRGRGQTEVLWLNGAVVRYGAKCGVPTPVNHTLTEMLEGLSNGKLRQERFRRKPEALFTLLYPVRGGDGKATKESRDISQHEAIE